MIDLLLKNLAILGIRIYQIFGRRFLHRTCLFYPSCSRRSLIFFRKNSFKTGLKLTRKQLSECKGDYSLRFDESGKVEMITHSGQIISECDINPKIVMKLKQFQFDSINITE